MHSVVLLPFFKLYSFFIQNCMNILQRSLYGIHKSREFHLPKSLSFQNQNLFYTGAICTSWPDQTWCTFGQAWEKILLLGLSLV